MSKLRVITIDARVWNSDVIIFIGGRPAQHARKFKRYHIKKDIRDWWEERIATQRKIGGAVTMHDHSKPWYVFIYFPTKPKVKKADDIEQATHELLHAAIHILRKKGVSLVPESEEAYTYLQGFLVREFFERL